MRHADFIGQINRETYAILLPDTTGLGGKIVSERIPGLTKTGNIMAGAIRVNTSVTIGGVTVSTDRPYYEAAEEEEDSDDFRLFWISSPMHQHRGKKGRSCT